MGLRETINEHRGVTIGAAIGVVVLALLVAWQFTGTSASSSAASAQTFYSVDDGAHYFTAPADKVPPFDYQGKQAYRAVVFTCDAGKTKFVGYLERYSPAAKQQIESSRTALKKGPQDPAPPPTMAAAGVPEVKRPGAKYQWASRASAAGAQAAQVTCPDGKGMPELVEP